ncbi:hypothetical protein REPUB_Repub17cG0036700 [Reevesia pubescens]
MTYRIRVAHCQSLVNGMSMTLHRLRDLQLSSTRLEMRKRQVARLSLRGEMTTDTSKGLFLESLSLRKNGFAVYKLLMQINKAALTELRASKRKRYLSTPNPYE